MPPKRPIVPILPAEAGRLQPKQGEARPWGRVWTGQAGISLALGEKGNLFEERESERVTTAAFGGASQHGHPGGKYVAKKEGGGILNCNTSLVRSRLNWTRGYVFTHYEPCRAWRDRPTRFTPRFKGGVRPPNEQPNQIKYEAPNTEHRHKVALAYCYGQNMTKFLLNGDQREY